MTQIVSATQAFETDLPVNLRLLTESPAIPATPEAAIGDVDPGEVPLVKSHDRPSLKTLISDNSMIQEGFLWERESPEVSNCRWRHKKTRISVYRYPRLSNDQWASAKLDVLLRVLAVEIGLASPRWPITH